jgi:phosphatidate cytidylyltransferase
LLAELATWEYLGLADLSGAKTPRIFVLVAIAVLFYVAYRDAELLVLVDWALILAICAFFEFL